MAEEELIRFNVDFYCTSDANKSLPQHTLNMRPSCKVSDVAKEIEESMEIPESQIKLKLNSAVLGRNASLKDLSLRNGDTLMIYYYARADCQEINECIQWMEGFLQWFEKYGELILEIDLNLALNLIPPIRGEQCLKDLCFTYFSPWLLPPQYANKLYFIAKDGLILVTKIMNNLLNIPPDMLDDQLQQIEASTLGILWNITEDKYIGRAVVRAGGIETCTRALLRLPIPECRHFPEETHIAGVMETIRVSLGVLANLCELPEIRLNIASNTQVIKQMLSIILSPSFESSIIHQVIMIFLDLSYTCETHTFLILQDDFLQFMKTDTNSLGWNRSNSSSYSDTLVLLSFYKAVLFAILLCTSPQYFDTENKKFVCELLNSFLKTADFQFLSLLENKQAIFWGTLSPLIKVLYQKEIELGPGEINFYDPCKLTVLIALHSLTSRQYHCEVLNKEEMVDYVVCLPWYTKGEVQEKAMELVGMIRESPEVHYQPPCLLNISKAAVSIYYCGLDNVMSLSVPELVSNILKD